MKFLTETGNEIDGDFNVMGFESSRVDNHSFIMTGGYEFFFENQ